MRHHQLQSRLATLKIENEEVRVHGGELKGTGVSVSFTARVLYTEISFSVDSERRRTYGRESYKDVVASSFGLFCG